MKRAILLTIFILLGEGIAFGASFIKAKDRVVKVRSEVLNSTQVRISWAEENHATSFVVARKLFGDPSSSWSAISGTLGSSATSYDDTVPAQATRYEYRVTKNTSSGYTAYGYTACGIGIAPVHSRGKILLVYTPGGTPSDAYKAALIADGWTLVPIALSAGVTDVTVVRGYIKTQYDLDPTNVKAVLLLGHVPVPYSGLFSLSTPPPDGHSSDHSGAWPSDLYYGDMSTSGSDWTDTGTQTSNINPDGRGSNSPGDKKWDTKDIHSDVELQVGRVDFVNVAGSAYGIPGKTEAELMQRYFDKNIAYRMGTLSVSRNSVVADYWQDQADAAGQELNANTCLSSTAWGNFPNFSGVNGSGLLNITPVLSYYDLTTYPDKNYFRTLNAASTAYLWSGAFGEGGDLPFEGISFNSTLQKFYIGRSKDFPDFDPKSVFCVYGGSYFGDWDSPGDNIGMGTQGKPSFLRAALGAQTYTLASMWAGRPHWFFHHMMLGETIGYSTRITQNNRPNGTFLYESADTAAAGWAHVALMGDPTLRTDIVRPPTEVTISLVNNPNLTPNLNVNLAWTHSADRGPGPGAAADFAGYYVYRASTADGPFTLRTANPVTGNSYSEGYEGNYVYMVRACKRERYSSTAGKGAFDNLSAGIIPPTGSLVRYATTSATGGWASYPFLNGGGSQTIYSTTTTINTTGLVNPAPQAVYKQLEAEGSTLTWTAGFLSPSSTYKVRVHLSSVPFTYYYQVGDRLWVNDATGAYSQDAYPYGSAGYYQAMIVQFTQNFTPNASGQISGSVVALSGLAGICGVEIVKNP